MLSSARALLVTFGLEPKKDREVFEAFEEHLIRPGWVKEQTTCLIKTVIDWRMGDKNSITDQLDSANDLINRIEQLFNSLGADLKFRLEPLKKQEEPSAEKEKTFLADLRGVACPLNFVKAKLALEKIPIGQELEILLDDGEPIQNVPASFADQGQSILEIKKIDDYNVVKIKRVH